MRSSSRQANGVLSGERFKRVDAANHDLATETFDRLRATYSAPLSAALVSAVGFASGDLVLDLGAGTDIVAKSPIEADARGSGGLVREYAADAARHAPGLRMDAECFAIRADSLDAVVSLFAVLHLPVHEAVLRASLGSKNPVCHADCPYQNRTRTPER